MQFSFVHHIMNEETTRRNLPMYLRPQDLDLDQMNQSQLDDRVHATYHKSDCGIPVRVSENV